MANRNCFFFSQRTVWCCLLSVFWKHLLIIYSFLFCIFTKNLYPMILISLERDRQTDRHWLVASRMCLDQGLKLRPSYVSWPRTEPATFWCAGWCTNQLSHLARSILHFISDNRMAMCQIQLPCSYPVTKTIFKPFILFPAS